MKKPLLSVVVPVFNELQNIEAFYARLLPVMEKLGGEYEIIYVDDGSRDGSAHELARLHKQNPRVKLLKLTRNFGKEIALSAGIEAAAGDAVITIDGDG